MDDKTFAEQLCPWFDPRLVAAGALTLAETPGLLSGGALEIRLSGPEHFKAKQVGLDVLIRKFLSGFQLPEEYLELLALDHPEVPREGWERLEALRFEGEVWFDGFSPEVPADTIVVLKDNPVASRLASGPVGFLIKQTAILLPTWLAVGDGDFFEHSHPGEFLTFIEYTIAVAVGRGENVRSATCRSRAQVLYADGCLGLSVIGEPPFGDLCAVGREGFAQLNDALATNSRANSRLHGEVPPQPTYDFEQPLANRRAPLQSEDGFEAIDEVDAGESWRNVARWRNECSPYSLMRSQTKASTLVVDGYYGRVFDFLPEENVGIYGITQALPAPAWTAAAQGFLRTPYRKVPRYRVKSRGELVDRFASSLVLGDGTAPLYRGQTAEHTLKRSGNARQILYGDANAIEPSLLSSSTRKEQPLEAVFPAWVLLVRRFLEWVWGNQVEMPEITKQVSPLINEDASRMLRGVDLSLYAISLAQHYGLPTMGLDVTDDLNTALFFALHRAVRIPDSRRIRYVRKGSGEGDSVLYVLAPDQRYRLVHDLCRPRTVGLARPEKQSARFLITGWGHHSNSAARHLGMAIYLDPGGDYGALPSARDLFPEVGEDLFGSFLERALQRGLPTSLAKYVEQLYWVSDN